MEAGNWRKRGRRRRGRCKDSSETKAASPVKEKTGEGGTECMKIRGEEACEREERESNLESMREKIRH